MASFFDDKERLPPKDGDAAALKRLVADAEREGRGKRDPVSLVLRARDRNCGVASVREEREVPAFVERYFPRPRGNKPYRSAAVDEDALAAPLINV